MKRISIAVMALISLMPYAFAMKPAHSTEPQFNEGVELMELIWRLMGAQEFSQCNIDEVDQSANTFFADMKDHDAVLFAKQHYRQGLCYDAIPSYGLHLVISEQGTISFNPVFTNGTNPGNPCGNRPSRRLKNRVRSITTGSADSSVLRRKYPPRLS